MHDEAHPSTDLPLEQLSTDELERLLLISDSEEPDVDFIIQVMEVIKFRQEQAGYIPQHDVNAAWQEFKEEYQGQANSYQYEDHHPSVTKAKSRRRGVHVFRRFTIVAVAIALLTATASAFGLDLFHVIAKWTGETFHLSFAPEESVGESSIAENDPYADLRETVSQYTTISVVPTWAPDGTKSDGEIIVTERIGSIQIVDQCSASIGEYTVMIQIFDTPLMAGAVTYQTETEHSVDIEVGGIKHYLFHNINNCGVVWVNENVKGYIQGEISEEDLIHMINSLYKE